ncbi:MAG TPA: efflux RND transporter permease subunit, partial [Candidatus Acidoferrum sp.]|nr:efflux RND transporter permease subunit [Candidatus Acidoferrum sp.]
LSSTLVPVFSTWLMRETPREERRGMLYPRFLTQILRFRIPLVALYIVAACGLVYILLPGASTEIFPDVNAPILRIRLRAASGTRIEQTERIVLRALDTIGREIGPEHVAITSDFVGVVPSSYPVNLIHLFTSGPNEALIQVALKPGTARGEALRERLRHALHRDLPDSQISFEAGDIITQVMSFGSPTPVEVAVQGASLADDYTFARSLQTQLAKLSFLRDLQFAQDPGIPTLDIAIDRDRAGQFGLTMADVVRSVVPATSSSRFTQPNYWRDPASGNAFQIQVQLPQNRMQSVEDVASIPVMENGNPEPRLSGVATLKPGTMPGMIERFNGQHIVSLTANIHGITLGDAAPRLRQAIAAAGNPPRGLAVRMRGEIPPLDQTIEGLRTGLSLAVLMIFLLLAANFQSLRLSLAIVLTIPSVLCGVLLMLRLTGTTLNIQSFMGAIMAIGIAVANSILLVTFAEQSRHGGRSPLDAAMEGASGRLRAVLMTAAAMIAGMIPMAIGIGEGGSQSAPLARAVIGGLIVSTFTTLIVLPSLYAVLQRNVGSASPSLNPMDPASRYYEA